MYFFSSLQAPPATSTADELAGHLPLSALLLCFDFFHQKPNDDYITYRLEDENSMEATVVRSGGGTKVKQLGKLMIEM